MAAVLTVSLLGPVSVAVDGAPVALRAKEAAVIATLALRPGMTVLTEELADAVWGGREDDPRAAVQVQVSRLRKALGPAAGLLATVAGGYRLDVEPVSVDAGGFEADASRARAALQAGRHREAFQAADAALGRWRGQALGGMAEGWAAAEARRLEEGRLLAAEDRAEALAVLDPARAARDLEPLAVGEPLRERRWALLAGALAASGRQADALRALARARAVLRDALGVDPGPELADLERRLLDQDPEVLVASRWQAKRRGWLPAPVSSFVGRQEELEELDAACATARLVTLTGTGGTGKTRLALARRGCTPRKVSAAVEATCHHHFDPATRVPVSSTWTTSTADTWSARSVLNSPRPSAARRDSPAKNPVETGAPKRSDMISAVRSTGISWRFIR
jgi:DNA-binding SARP family transcriptional activator